MAVSASVSAQPRSGGSGRVGVRIAAPGAYLQPCARCATRKAAVQRRRREDRGCCKLSPSNQLFRSPRNDAPTTSMRGAAATTDTLPRATERLLRKQRRYGAKTGDVRGQPPGQPASAATRTGFLSGSTRSTACAAGAQRPFLQRRPAAPRPEARCSLQATWTKLRRYSALHTRADAREDAAVPSAGRAT